MRSSLAVCGALLTAILLGACGGGGDDGPTPEEEAKTAAVRAIENGDAATFCRKQVSKGYLERVYDGDVAACAKSEGSVPEEASSARATKAMVKGDETHAEVTVVLKGGSYDGATGGVEMVKEGEAWKLDDYDDEKGNKLLLGMAANCPESALAEYGATTLTEGLTEKGGKHKPGYVKCLYKEFRFLLEVTGITTELLKEHPGFAAVAALEGIAEGAKKNCGG